MHIVLQVSMHVFGVRSKLTVSLGGGSSPPQILKHTNIYVPEQ